MVARTDTATAPPIEEAPRGIGEGAALDLSGSGRHFLWSILPTLVTTLGGVFVLSYSVRVLGPANYGAVVTITAGTTLLLLFSGALRYAVVHSGARSASDESAPAGSSRLAARSEVRAAHTLFVGAAGVILAAAVMLGWLLPLDLHEHGPAFWHLWLAAVMFVGGASLPLAVNAYAGVLTSQDQWARLAQIGLVGFGVQVGLTVLLAPRFQIFGLAWATIGSSLVQAVAFVHFGRRRAHWLRLRPRRLRMRSVRPVVRYALGIAVLSATSTISTTSDSFVIAAVAGAGAVTVFRIGSTGPTTLGGLLNTGFGVLFPRLVRSGRPEAQEEGVAWMGRVVGWVTGVAFGAMALLADDIVAVLLGHHSQTAVLVLLVCAGATAIDVAYHGVVQVLFARGEQGRLAKYTWIELVVNLGSTVGFVAAFGPLGSALAFGLTIIVTDVVGFPIIMRGRWGSPAGRFVLRNGQAQMIAAAICTLGLGVWPLRRLEGLPAHVAVAAVASAVTLGAGAILLGRAGRSRLWTLA